jgi:hypothetical protein
MTTTQIYAWIYFKYIWKQQSTIPSLSFNKMSTDNLICKKLKELAVLTINKYGWQN